MKGHKVRCRLLSLFVFLLRNHDLITWALSASSPSSSRSATRRAAKHVARSLLTIGKQIQNPHLYPSQWADACVCKEELLISSRDVQAGEILSLYPFHALGLSSDESCEENLLILDETPDGEYFNSISSTQEDSFSLPCLCLENREPELSQFRLSLHVNPKRPSTPGWLGHLARCAMNNEKANCVVAPLLGAAPLCALIAFSYLSSGTKLVRDPEWSILADNVVDQALERYAPEIAELRSYTNMAYPPRQPIIKEERGVFYSINRNYPGLKSLHLKPDILVVEQFLSENECDSIIAMSRPHLKPCLIKNSATNAVEQDPSRTSTNANLAQSQVPSIVSKLRELLNCQADHLEIIQILRYQKGQEFQPHMDGFDGPITACGFEESGRLVTIFCYLNDVHEGGETRFTKLSLDIQPRKGMAVIHFPNTLALEEDEQTVHAGVSAVHEKWLLVTWVWKHARSDPRYGEDRLRLLHNGVIL